MAKQKNKGNNASKARDIDRQNLQSSLKDEADGFYHFESDLKKFMISKDGE